MSNKSKAKAIAELLLSDVTRWWSWYEILEALIPDFSSAVITPAHEELLELYLTYLPHVYAELDERGRFLLRDRKGVAARFKIATTAPEDRVRVEDRLISFKKRERAISNKLKQRIGSLKEEKILPEAWKPRLPA